MFRTLLRRQARGDSGAAMVTAILVMVVITGMGSVVVQVASSNLRNAGRDRVAGGALGAAEAGLAAGSAYLTGERGISSLSCAPTCTTNDWGNAAAPHELLVGSEGATAEVYIDVVRAFNPPTDKVARYEIHSKGTTGTGPGTVELAQMVDLKPYSFPIGVYADTIGAAGGAAVHYESLFTKGCVNKRSHITFSPAGVNDLWYGFPAGVHSVQYITESNNTCSNGDASNIHKTSVCNTSFPYDRDAKGGAVTTTSACASAGGASPPSTNFTIDDLEKTIGLQPRGLTTAQYAALKAKAQAMGQYYTTASYTAPDPAVYPNAVMYFKVATNQTVQIQNQLNAYGSAYCGSRSLIIVIEGGGLHTNAGANITAAIFVPDGTYRGNGSGQVHGTLYAKYVEKFTGTADFYLESCFFANLPGGLLEVTPVRFKVDDR